ncbi:MAG: LptF/LptG family permease [Gemmatimonadota bacterium]
MRLITRHIVRALAAPFLWGIVALTGLLLLNQISELINQFGGKGLPFDVMLEAVILALPALLTLTIPMAVLVSTLYGYSQLAADQEMVAMYANGISVWRMVRPALVAAVGVALVNFILFDQVVPRSNIRFRALKIDVMNKTPTLALRPALLNPLGNTSYILRAATIDGSTGRMTGVTIYDLSSYEGRKVLHADSGRMAESPNGTDLLLTLRRGEQLDIKSADPGRIEVTRFLENRITIRGVANELQRSDDRSNERGDREMSGCQLLDGVADQEWEVAEQRRQQEYFTRRDLRHLAGLSPVISPASPTQPKLPPHCGKYRDFEEWFGHLMVPNLKPRDTTPMPPDERLKQPQPTTDPEPTRARLPRGTVAVVPPMPQQLPPAPVPAPAVSPEVAAGKAAADSSAAGTPPVKKPGDGAPPADSNAPLSPDSAKAILSAVVPTNEHTPGADSALALALRQRAMNTPIPQSNGALLPQVADTGNRNFLVPPVVQQIPGPVGTIEEVRSRSIQIGRATSLIRQYEVEYHKKFSIPLASFCFVLLGVALALRFPRSGIGLVIGASLVIFMAFYVLLIGGENVANKGYISPITAMHGPVVLFTILGLVGVIVANREMGTARTGGILDGLLSIIRWPFRRKT